MSVRIYRDPSSLSLIIEGYGNWNLNFLTITNPTAAEIRIDEGQEEIDTWDFSEILDIVGASAGASAAAVLAYLNAENTEALAASAADVTVIAQAEAAAATAALVDSAPVTLDTLNELAAALGDDPNFATTTTAAIGAAQTDATQALADAAAAQGDATQALADALAANNNANTRLQSVVAGTDITIDNTDPINPIVNFAGAGAIYGSEFQFEQSDTIQVVTSLVSPNNILTGAFPGPSYLTMTTPALPAGTYELEWNYQWNGDTTTSDFLARINQDSGAAFFGFHRQEPKDTAGGGNTEAPAGTGSNQRHPASGRRVVVLTAGVHTFELEHATGSSGDEASIMSATMTFKRVA